MNFFLLSEHLSFSRNWGINWLDFLWLINSPKESYITLQTHGSWGKVIDFPQLRRDGNNVYAWINQPRKSLSSAHCKKIRKKIITYKNVKKIVPFLYLRVWNWLPSLPFSFQWKKEKKSKKTKKCCWIRETGLKKVKFN